MSPRLMGEAAYHAGAVARRLKYLPVPPLGSGQAAFQLGRATTQRPIRGVAAEGPGVANAQPNQNNIPRPPTQQKHGGRIAQQKHFAQGGNASDDQYSDFRPSTNVEDYRNESPLHKAETNFMLNVTGQKDNWISDLSNAITGHKRQSAPQYAKGGKVKRLHSLHPLVRKFKARKAKDGQYYARDPERPGKYMRLELNGR